jgi:hypothetical protein
MSTPTPKIAAAGRTLYGAYAAWQRERGCAYPDWEALDALHRSVWYRLAEAACAHFASWPHDALDGRIVAPRSDVA